MSTAARHQAVNEARHWLHDRKRRNKQKKQHQAAGAARAESMERAEAFLGERGQTG